MKTIVLQSDSEYDLNLLLGFAQRLGIHFFEMKATVSLGEIAQINNPEGLSEAIESDIPDTSTLYEGLNLSKEVKFYRYDELPKEYDQNQLKPYTPNYSIAQLAFGALEDDEDESLEDLLNMLTP
jgi:hypothetical protein